MSQALRVDSVRRWPQSLRGARLVLTGRSAEGLAEVAGGLEDAEIVPLDLAAPGAAEAAAKAALAGWGWLDVLVNNADLLVPGAAPDCSDEDWDCTFALNVTAVFRLLRTIVRVMRGQGDRAIVSIASDWALVGARGGAGLCCLHRRGGADHPLHGARQRP